MKAFKLFTAFLIFTLFTGTAFTSCSSDDDESDSTGITGTWTNGSYTITFKTNGSFTSNDGDGTYSFNNKTLILIYEDGYGSEVFTVTLNGNTFIWEDEDGDRIVLQRVTDSEDDETGVSIVGTWQYEEEDFVNTITISSNGSFRGVTKEYYQSSWHTTTETGTYTYTGGVLTMHYSDNTSEVYTVVSLTATKLTVYGDGETTTFTRQ